VPRHAAGDRVDRVLHGHAHVRQLLGQLHQRVLRTGHRQAVAGNDDHGVGVGQQEGGVVGRTGLHVALQLRARRAAGIGVGTEAAEDHVEERAVHRLAHDVREDRAARAYQRAGDDQHRVVQREADTGGRPARIRVEHRHHHRHVRTADGDDDQHADDERQRHQDGEGGQVAGEGVDQAQADDCQAHSQVDHVLALEYHRGALEQAELVLAGQLAEGDHRTGEGDGTDGRAEEQLQAVTHRNRVTDLLDDAQRLRLDHRGDGDEHRGQADHAVHEGDQLGHLGHLDALGHDGADAAADQQADDHVADAGGGQLAAELEDQADRGQYRQAHADHAEQVAAS